MQKAKILWFHLYEMSGKGKSRETENTLVIASIWSKRENGECWQVWVFFLSVKMF